MSALAVSLEPDPGGKIMVTPLSGRRLVLGTFALQLAGERLVAKKKKMNRSVCELFCRSGTGPGVVICWLPEQGTEVARVGQKNGKMSVFYTGGRGG